MRDQVCPSSNKGGCLLTHPHFVICKPDLFDHTADLTLPPSHRLSASISVQLSPSKDGLRIMVSSPFLVVKIGCVQFE